MSRPDGRAEHLAWCKERALAYLDAGEPVHLAFQSLGSDLRKYPDTAKHPALELGMMQLVAGQLDTPAQMRRFIEGCH